jgi:hypothetical protein
MGIKQNVRGFATVGHLCPPLFAGRAPMLPRNECDITRSRFDLVDCTTLASRSSSAQGQGTQPCRQDEMPVSGSATVPRETGKLACHSFGTGLKWKTDRPPPRVRASSSWDKAHMRRTLVSAQAQAFVMAPVTGSRKMKAHGRKPRWSQIRWSSGGLLKVGGIHELSPGRCIQSDSPEQPPHAQYPTTRCMKLSPAGSKRTQKAS